MNYKKYEENDLLKYLLSHAAIENFYITCLGASDAESLNYFDSTGKTWYLMEDDEILIHDAIKFLKSKGTPIFYDVDLLRDFEKSKADSNK